MTDGSDKVVPLTTPTELLGRSLSQAVGRRRMELILDKPEARALVQALPSEDLYFLVKEVGLQDAAELVGLASPEQFQAFVDLDAWRREPEGSLIAPETVLEWLAVAREGDAETQPARVAGLDLEVLEYVLKDGLHIVDRRELEETPQPLPRGPEGQDLEWHETPCGNFYVAFRFEGGAAVELKRLLDEFYAQNPFGAARLLTAVRWEISSELEETAGRFREARLEDLGFPPPEEAASLYAFTDPAGTPPPQPEPAETLPGFFLAEFRGGSFLDRAAAAVTGPEVRTRLDRGLMYLANSVLTADRIDPSDLDAVREAVTRMRAYLNLGLSHLAGPDVARGAGLLATASLKHLFQVGFSLTLQLTWRAEGVARSLGRPLSEAAALFDPPEADVLAALAGARPRFAAALDHARAAGWPEDPSREPAVGAPAPQALGGQRPFVAPGDLAAVEAVLDRVAAQARAALAAGLAPAPEAADPGTLPTRAATAAVSLAAGGALSAEPVTVEDLGGALPILFDEAGALRERSGAGLRQRLEAAGAAPEDAALLAREASLRLASELGPVLAAGGRPDPRFVLAVRLRA